MFRNKKLMRVFSGVLSLCLLSGAFSGCSVLGGGTDDPVGDTDTTIDRVADERDLADTEYTLLNLAGTDALDRTFTSADSEDKDLYVGMFYFLWLGQHASEQGGIYDVTEITDDGEDMDAFYTTNDSSSPVGQYHFWGQPMWDYYRSDDEWVIRKQIEMLTMAGVDYLYLDTTNGFLYDDVTAILFEVLQDYYDQGWDVPKVMYYVATEDVSLITELYEDFYSQGKYEDLWFAPDGKPMITVLSSTEWDTDDYTEGAIADFFDFRYRQWPNDSFLRNGWPWMEFEYPQPVHTDAINVSVAQHTSLKMSSTDDNWGRGYDWSMMQNDSTLVDSGSNYESQWETVLYGDEADSIRFVNVTGWNEWIALKLGSSTPYYMVDQFNQEYSRDIEPMSGGHGDNYYMQTIQNIREWKYTDPVHYQYADATLDISDFSEENWKEASVYRDFTGECMERDSYSFDSSYPITDDSNRNDIASVSVLHDSDYLYMRIETLDDITDYEDGDTGWMNVLLSTGSDGDNLLGYQYCVNRSVSLDTHTATVSEYSGSSWVTVSSAEIYTEGNVLQLCIRLSDLGLDGDDFSIEFKVTDNIQSPKKSASYYTTGDSAPIGRLSYTYGY